MKQFTKRAVSSLLTAAIALCSFTVAPANAADESTEPKEVTVTFDCSGEGIALAPDEEGNIPEGIDGFTDKPGSSYTLPEQKLEKAGYSFEGWTFDGVKGFQPGMVIQLPEEDAVLKPVWCFEDYDDSYKLNYTVEIDGKLLGKGEKPSPFYAPPGKIVKVSTMSCEREGYYQKGWYLEDGTEFYHGEYIIMPDHDVEFTPIWKKYVIINYVVGDVDRINGAKKADFEKLEGGSIELQKSDRFSRSGFKLTGWLCSLDNQVYLPEQTFTVPGVDIDMTAVWTPITYNIVFNPGTGSADIQRIKGTTDTTITLPECTAVKSGYKFDGWKYDNVVYQPGDEYFIEGVMPGLGYAFTAVWSKDNGEVTTTTSATTTTTTTSSSTTASETTTVYEESTTFFDPGSTTYREIDYYSIELFDKESGEPVYDEEISCVAIIDEYPHGSTSEILSCTPTKDKPGIIGLDHSDGYPNYYVTSFATASTSKYEILNGNIETRDIPDSKIIGVKIYLTKRPAVRIRFFDERTGYAFHGANAYLLKLHNDGTPGDIVETIDLKDGYIYDIPKLEDETAEYTILCASKSETTSPRSQLPFKLNEDGSTVQVDVYIQPWYYNAGDANCDGDVNIADAVLVMQVATNPDKYAQGNSEFSISSMGAVNADVDGKKGLSNADALLIQKFKLGLIESFHE